MSEQPNTATHRPVDLGDSAFTVDESIGYLVNRLARTFARALSERLARHGVMIAQWAVLVCLWDDDGASQRELSRKVAIEPATMVRTLDRMERDDLVRRSRSRQDRRVINVYLTERGHALRDVLTPYAGDVNAIATSRLDAAERDLLPSLLSRMIAALDEAQRQPTLEDQ